MTRVIILPQAVDDVEKAAAWYESRQAGLGIRFIEELDAAVERISQNPAAYEVRYRTTRRALMKRFPYSVYYVHEGGSVEIIAILHQHMSRDSWQTRVE